MHHNGKKRSGGMGKCGRSVKVVESTRFDVSS